MKEETNAVRELKSSDMEVFGGNYPMLQYLSIQKEDFTLVEYGRLSQV